MRRRPLLQSSAQPWDRENETRPNPPLSHKACRASSWTLSAPSLPLSRIRRITGAGTPQQQSTPVAGVSDAVTLAFGAPWAAGEPHAVYIMGVVQGRDGIWVSRDLGGTWAEYATAGVTVGNEPVVMEASLDEPGRVFVGTNGRGIYQAL